MNTQEQTYIKTKEGKYVPRLYTPTEPRIYRTIRFRFNGRPRTLKNGLTETEAQAHCSRKDTRGNGWFDGYDYMKGYRP
jgi:hypothetical protein